MTFSCTKPSPMAIGYFCALLLCAISAAVCLPLLGYLDQANIVMLFLLNVATASVLWGKGPGALSAFSSVLLFDILFVEPRFSLAVLDGQYLITFGVMLIVALLISHFSTRLQEQLNKATEREQQITTLYQCAHELAGAMALTQVQQAMDSLAAKLGTHRMKLYLPDVNEQLVCVTDHNRLAKEPERTTILSAYQGSAPLFSSVFASPETLIAYLPLQGATRPRGVLVIEMDKDSFNTSENQNSFYLMLSSLLATALERLHFVEVAQSSELARKAETLRSTILSSISHDIRTPLTVLVGTADTLLMTNTRLPSETITLLRSLRDQAFTLHDMVENLLEMARLQSGNARLKREWIPMEELTGSSIRLLGDALASHKVQVRIAPEISLVYVDPVLMERVLYNLLNNARQYATPGSTILINASQHDKGINLSIHNVGPPFPDHAEELMKLFARGDSESAVHGFGVGLAICRSIVEAHGGTITLQTPAEGGACVIVHLPQASAPAVEKHIETASEQLS